MTTPPLAPSPHGTSLVQLGRRDVTERLVDLLLACHERIRGFIRLAQTIADDEAAEPPTIVESCQRVERYFADALPLHVADEEKSLEPRLAGKSAEIDAALRTMHDEHTEHARDLEALLATLREVAAVPDAQDARARLGTIAARLGVAFEEHLALEERVLFPAISALLLPEVQAEIVRELRLRREAPEARVR